VETVRTRAELGQEAFELLLRALDPVRENAGERYEGIRARLLRFFLSRNAPRPEDLADETIDRVCRKLAQGEVIRSADLGRYFLGVARNVMRESWDLERRRRETTLPAEALLRAPADEPSDDDASSSCLERCLESLEPASRDALLSYYRAEPQETLEKARRELASRLGVRPNALRIRMHRLRMRLEACTRRCLQGGETSPPGGPLPGRGPGA
jgi:DNA-directed RNA polymerase specialized sigma24 family protein